MLNWQQVLQNNNMPQTLEDTTQGNAQSDSDSNKDSSNRSVQAADANSQVDAGRRVRRRISRACDHCNASRRKCDGKHPCGYCLHTSNVCEYKRQLRKRGKASIARPIQEKTIQPHTAAANEDFSLSICERDQAIASLEHNPNSNITNSSLPTNISNSQDLPLSQLEAMADDYQMFNLDFEGFGEVFEHAPLTQDNNSGIRGRSRGPGSESLGSMLGIQTMQSNNRRHVYGVHSFEAIGDAAASSSELPPSLPSPTNLLNISRSGMLGQAMSDAEQRKLHSIPRQERSLRNASGIRYPVLQDLMPFLRPLMPDALAYDLLEAYFRVNPVTNAQLTPCAPPLVFRRQSFLRHEQPRRSTRALLASMLWLSAQTADIPILNASVARRKYVRRKLLELTTNSLKPLNEVSLGSGFPQSVGSSSQDRTLGEGEFSSHSDMADSVDEIMAYVHLAMVTSASEFKGASLRWWNVAFSLAHEAKLHQEITESLFDGMSDGDDTESPHPLLSSSYPHEPSQNFRLDDERKEERHRIWWFLYTMDRHLSFSYNKPLCLLDSECQNLNRPCDDAIWQSDHAYDQSEAHPLGKGPWFECTGPTFFGFFTPLMALLGEIVYFVQAQNHPRFGVSQSTLLDWKNWEKGIEDRLKLYQKGLETLLLTPTTRDDTEQGTDFQARGSISNPRNSSPPISTAPVRNRIAYAYSNIILHVLFILLMGKWDPHTLLNVSNDWLSSVAFGRAIGHAVDAASSAEMLLDLDPDAHFMPFFINIYLFHGSMPILLVADRVGHDAAAAIVHAADTMVRVQETGAIRMPAEYQTLFVSVLRSALLEMQGRTLFVSDDSSSRRRQVLRQYRWTVEGRGLAC